MIEVIAEPALSRRGEKILAGGRQNPDVERFAPRAPEAANRSFLQRRQQLRLQRNGCRADLVQEDGATVGALEQSLLALAGVGECSSLKAKQLRFEQRLWNGGTVHGDEWPARPNAGTMDCAGEQPFARAGFSKDEDEGQAARGFLMREQSTDLLSDGRDPWALADQLSQLLHWIVGMVVPWHVGGKAREMDGFIPVTLGAARPSARTPRADGSFLEVRTIRGCGLRPGLSATRWSHRS